MFYHFSLLYECLLPIVNYLPGLSPSPLQPEPLSPAPRGPPGLAPLPPEVSTTLADILLELRELNKTMRLLTGSISRSSEVPPRGAPAGLVTGARPSMESHDAVNTLLALADSDDDIYDSLSLQAICDACAVSARRVALGVLAGIGSPSASPGRRRLRQGREVALHAPPLIHKLLYTPLSHSSCRCLAMPPMPRRTVTHLEQSRPA